MGYPFSRPRLLLTFPLMLVACGAPPTMGNQGPPDAALGDAGIDGGDAVDGGVGDAGVPDAGPVDAGPRRDVWLAATGMQAFTSTEPSIFQWTPADLASDVDVVGVFGEFYGIPWSHFAADGGPLPGWGADVQRLATRSRALGKPLFLSLTLGRDGLIQNATATPDGGYATTPGWAPCFDFTADGGAKMQQAYVAYVRWMMGTFRPAWVNVAVEVNLYGNSCPSAWPGVAQTVNAAYLAAKAHDPNVIAFESYVLETLYGETNCAAPQTAQQCADADYARISMLKRDRFGISTYPNRDPATLEADYFVRAANRGDAGPETVIIAETGYNSAPLVVGDGVDAGSCVTYQQSSPAKAAAYVQRLLADAQKFHVELVDWSTDRDLLPAPVHSGCPCTYAADWCAIERFFQQAFDSPLFGDLVFKAFGSMGLRDYDGSPKPLVLPAWQAVQAIPRSGT